MSARCSRTDILPAIGALVSGLLVLGIAGCSTPENLPPLVLRDLSGEAHQPLTHAGERATVLFFVMHDCPLARTCAPEINRLVAECASRGVRSYLVYAEPELAPAAAQKHADDFGHKCPGLLDPWQELARFTGVKVSPEVAVLSPANELLYRGRIDDRLSAFGKLRAEPSRRDLRDALDAILAGKPAPNRLTKAVGCYLPTADRRKSGRPPSGNLPGRFE